MQDAMITLKLRLSQVEIVGAGLSALPLGKALDTYLTIKEQAERQVAEIQAGPSVPQRAAVEHDAGRGDGGAQPAQHGEPQRREEGQQAAGRDADQER